MEMVNSTLDFALVLIQALIGGGIWGIPRLLFNRWKKGETVNIGKLAVTFGTAIATVLVSHYGGLPVPEAAYWVEALGISAVISQWYGEFEKRLDQKAPDVPPPPSG